MVPAAQDPPDGRRPVRRGHGLAAGLQPTLHHPAVHGGDRLVRGHRRGEGTVRRHRAQLREPGHRGPHRAVGVVHRGHDELRRAPGFPPRRNRRRCRELRHAAGPGRRAAAVHGPPVRRAPRRAGRDVRHRHPAGLRLASGHAHRHVHHPGRVRGHRHRVQPAHRPPRGPPTLPPRPLQPSGTAW